MPAEPETLERLLQIPNLHVSVNAPLARYTRFGIGGPADIYAETTRVDAFLLALREARASGRHYVIIGGGTNLIVADEGFRGIVLRYTGCEIHAEGTRLSADAGAELQEVVDFATARGLGGLETLAGIPGSLGAAIYGNAGAYGHAISESVRHVRFFDGHAVRLFTTSECEFRYRDSIFKRHKDWIVFSAELLLEAGDPEELRRTAADIVAVRNVKFPPSMKCAGSIFKNLLFDELPATLERQVSPALVRDGKVPAAYFLEQAGAKGLARGAMRVADYHANLIYNAGAGTARDLRALIADLKQRVRDRFGIDLQEEVQYVGFSDSAHGR